VLLAVLMNISATGALLHTTTALLVDVSVR